MNKAYNRINWENYPSDSTPLNENNLNKMDVAINEIDNRVISLDTTKLPVATAYTMVKDVEFDEKTGVFTITKLNGSVIKIDTALEKISTNFRFDHSTQKLILTLIDGTTQEVDLSALLTQYEFTDSDTIAFTIDTSGKVVASVKKGSITQDMLEPNYLANIKVEVAKAESASLSADTSAKNAKTSETNAKISEEKAREYAEASSGIGALISSFVTGTNPTIQDSTNAPIISQIINGYTVQDGTPTSDTPVEIESLGELQEDGSYKVAVKTCGKNLFNPNTVISGEIIEADGTFRAYTAEENYTRSLYSRSDYIPCNANTNYYFENVMPLSVAYTVGCYDENKQFLRKLSFSGNSATVSGVLNTGDNTKYMVVCYKTTNVDTVMVAKSDTATEYEPYTETTAELSLSEPLYEGDYIEYRADGTGVLHRKMAKVVFDGSENWSYWSATGINQFYLSNIKAIGTANKVNVFSSHFKGISINERYHNYETIYTGYTGNSGDVVHTAINTEIATDVDAWETWLQSNPITVLYKLAEPTETPLTAEQVEQFKQLYTFEPVTNVFCDGEVELLYYKNTDNGETVGIVHKKVEASEKAIEDMQTEFEQLPNTFAKKSLYDDTTINVGRKADTTVGTNSITFGTNNTASGDHACAIGYGNTASKGFTFAGGKSTTASGTCSHTEGYSTTASGNYSHAEGKETTVTGNNSHAEGYSTTASGTTSHAEGSETKAEGDYSHAEGKLTTASGTYSHAEGYGTTASRECSHAEGWYTTALTLQHAMGTYNDTSLAKDETYNGMPMIGSTDGTAFVIGNGSGDGSETGFPPSNAFRVTYKGVAIGKSSFASSGADYAEYFEWKDGNSENEDRVGYFVTFADGRFIKKANEGDYILGIVSGMPCVIGNNDECWMQQFEMDIWGRFIYETRIVTDKETGEEKECIFYKVNPDYDSTKPYIHREKRPEWSAIGMFGVLSVYDDGTCQVNGYCKCGNNGIATAAERGTDTYRVLERINDNVIKVALK